MAQPQSHAARRLMGIQSRHRQYQDGGQVRGPGTGTSDSIPARLSDGEFVLPADTVHKVGVKSLRDLVHATHTPVKAKPGRHNYANGDLATADEQKRPNSFGDAAAAASNPGVTQVAAAPAPVAAPAAEPAATVANIPQPALKSVPAGVKSFGDAAAAAADPSVTQVQAAPVPAPKSIQDSAPAPTPSERTQMPALPGAAPASLDSRVSQIPTGGMKAPAPDGSHDSWSNTEVGRNVTNSLAALPGVAGALPTIAKTGGVISSGMDAASRLLNAGAGVAVTGGRQHPPWRQARPSLLQKPVLVVAWSILRWSIHRRLCRRPGHLPLQSLVTAPSVTAPS